MITRITTLVLTSTLTMGSFAPLAATAGGMATEVAEARQDDLLVATNANACGEQAVISAAYTDAGQLEVVCDDVTGSVPLLGGAGTGIGLATLAGLGLLAASSSGRSDTTQ